MTERRIGPKPKRTPELLEALCGKLRIGATRTAACAFVGIDVSTFYLWLERFPAISGQVARAEADAELRFLEPITTAAVTDWRAGAFWLERRRPNEYGPKAQIGGEVVLDVSAILRDHLVKRADPQALPEPDVIDFPQPPPSTNGHVTQD